MGDEVDGVAELERALGGRCTSRGCFMRSLQASLRQQNGVTRRVATTPGITGGPFDRTRRDMRLNAGAGADIDAVLAGVRPLDNDVQ